MNKKGKTMKEKRISFGQGKGSLTHNNREFMADNVDPLRTPQNITFMRQPIGEAYDQLFAESTARYNAKQKRNDRKVHGSYYEHLFGVKPCNTVRTAADKRKSFYEDVVQIGKREDSGYGTEDFQLVADCLKEYMEGFQERNPNFYVFNAVLHMDEATPHLHRLLQTIRQAGAKAGVAINPATPISVLDYIMEDIDNVLIMGINPGCTMQSLIPSTLGKVRDVRAKINAAKLPITIEVDGGMDPGSCLPYIQAGVDIIVLGRSFFNSADRRQLIADLHAMC